MNYGPYSKFLGATPLPASTVNYVIPGSTLPPTKPLTFAEKLTNIFSSVQTTVDKAAPLVATGKSIFDTIKQTTKGSGSTIPAYNPSLPSGPNNVPPLPTAGTGMSTTTKLLIGAAVVTAAGIVYAVTRKKKKSLGEVVDITHEVVSTDLAGTKKKKSKKRKK